MSSVDDRVVNLKFDNKQFESASATSMSTMDKLKKSLDFSGSKKGVDDLSGALGRMRMGPLGTEIEGINGKLLAMGTIGVTALSNITNRAVDAGVQIVKSLTIDPVSAGFKDYELQINAIQTIMANTGLEGAKGLGVVEKVLANLNEYANLTIYDFSQMTENIGRFTAAGVAIAPATDAIKGMSNVAALTGANTLQLSSAMYQMSQALSTGVIRLMDWNSLANANMGTQNMQNVLKATATTLGDHGKLMEQAIKKSGNFRDSLQAGWLTTEVFTKAMGVMAGTVDTATGKYRAFTLAELKGKGYTDEQAKALRKLSQAAIDSAINIRTYSQMIEALREGVATAWGAIFKTLFGNIFQATTLWTNLYNVLYDAFTKPIYALNTFLQAFARLGGMKDVMAVITNAFAALNSVLAPIKAAWATIFPPTTVKEQARGLRAIVVAIRDFLKAITLGPQQMALLKSAFEGVFSILKIGGMILGGVFNFFKNLFGLFSSGGSGAATGLLSVAAGLGKMVTNFATFLQNSGVITKFFDNLLIKLTPVVDFLKKVGDAIRSAFAQAPAIFQNLGNAAASATGQLSPFQKVVQFLSQMWDKFTAALQSSLPFFQGIGDGIKNMFSGVGDGNFFSNIIDRITTGLSKINWVNIFKVGVGAGLVAMMASFVRVVWSMATMLSSLMQIPGAVLSSLDSLQGVLKSYQNNLKAKSLLSIGLALLALAVAIKILSTIEPAALGLATGAIIVMMVALTKMFNGISEAQGNLLKGAATMIAMAIAMDLLAIAIFALGKMDPAVAGQGMEAVVLMLLVFTGALRLMPTNAEIAKAGASILLIAFAMNVLATAILAFGLMKPEVIGQGMAAVTIMLLGIVGMLRLMPSDKQILKAAGAIILMAFALNLMIVPIMAMGLMNPEKLAQGMLSISLMLLVLVGAMNLMQGTIAGAFALLVVSAALIVLSGAIAIIAQIGFGSAILGILALAIAMATIAVVAMVFTSAVPVMLAFGIALMALGAGFALIGLGALAFATAMSIVIGLMTLGVPVLADAINNLIDIIPLLAKAFYVFLVDFSAAFAAAVPQVVAAIVIFLSAILKGIDDMTPKIMHTLGVLLDAFLGFLIKYIPKINDAGLQIIDGLLEGLSKNMPDIIKHGTDVIVAFIKGIGDSQLAILKAAGDTLIKFMEGLTTWINTNQSRMNTAGHDLVKAIIDGMISGVASLGSGAIDSIVGIAKNAIDAAKRALGINSPSKVFIAIGKGIGEGFTIGILGGRQQVIDAVRSMTTQIKDAATKAAEDVKRLQDNVKKLEAKPKTKANTAALAKAKADLKQAEAEKKRLDAAYKTIRYEKAAQIKELAALGSQYESVSKKLEDAQQKYEDAAKEMADYSKQVKDQFSALPALDATSSLDDYFNAIRQATADNIKFKATMEQLRKLGLDDNQYKNFMEQGVKIQPFLDSLLASGGSTIAELNSIDSSLVSSATSLGKSASEALYKAGVDAAKGLVDGLTAQMKSITDKMTAIGKAIADEIKKELGIKSPSKVFKEIGANTIVGLAQGMDANSNVIDLAARRAGKTAIDALKSSMTSLPDFMDGEIDIQPTIAPVLDLTAFRKDASGINDILATKALEASVSAQNAQTISSTAEALAAAREASMGDTAPTTLIQLSQTNNSPKALSSAEIYRQTKNQLSIVKGALSG